MRGLRRTWVKGPRTPVESTNGKGQRVVRLGKRGGPVIAQRVELVLTPKEPRC